MKASAQTLVCLACGVVVWALVISGVHAAENPLDWPVVTPQAKPHAYWWWMGSAVDTNNIAKELARYRDAGLGGVHIIPIYGAKGWESNCIPYLSPKWMQMLDFTVTEAKRLGLEVDMTTGTGWCFGGPKVSDEEANAVMVRSQWTVASGQKLPGKLDRTKTQSLMAFGPEGKKVDLLGKILASGSVDWTAPAGQWSVYAITQKVSGQKVKRAAPGGEGWMLNLAYPQAMTNYLRWMDAAFANYKGAKPRAQYHDSYEYKMDWSPSLLAAFEKRRGYRLQDELDVFLTGQPADRAARVKCDYRETISDIMAEETLPMWNKWAHERGYITRNEAHGSPGNWLDLYATADIPETEMFHLDRNKLISKFASSAAHVTGKLLVGAETGTWLAEHFTETLADMKYLLDDLFLSGVNHVFYHGTCYSPDGAPWPGWVFYASYEMNPRNAVWHDVAALNAYTTRCQSVLQAGQPDNDILLYWPIHDFWSNPEGMARNLTVHARDWFEDQPIGQTAKQLWDEGYAFDYVSDAQLKTVKIDNGVIQMPGGAQFEAILVPKCKYIPLETFRQLLALAKKGAAVVFEKELPEDISGLSDAKDRDELKRLLAQIPFRPGSVGTGTVQAARFGNTGHIVKGDLRPALLFTAVGPQSALNRSGLSSIRRLSRRGGWDYHNYFIANHSGTNFDGWIPFGPDEKTFVLLDPMTGATGHAARRQNQIVTDITEIHLQLLAGESVILRTADSKIAEGPAWNYWQTSSQPVEITGQWNVKFIQGGPTLPGGFAVNNLASWTSLGDTNAASFAGTASYQIKFDAPVLEKMQPASLDLGRVCQSARVRLNGRDYGTLFTPPFRVVVDNLKARDNVLEVEVTNTSANRIRDLDRRGVKWQNFHDINFVNLNYQKFDAANWPVSDSGLLGPVLLTPVQAVVPVQ